MPINAYDDDDYSEYVYGNGPMPVAPSLQLDSDFVTLGNSVLPSAKEAPKDVPLVPTDTISAPRDLIRAVSAYLLDAQAKIPAAVKVQFPANATASGGPIAAQLTSTFRDSVSTVSRAVTRTLLVSPQPAELTQVGPAVPSSAPPPTLTTPCGSYTLSHHADVDAAGHELSTGYWSVRCTRTGTALGRIATPHATVAVDPPSGFFCLSGASFGPAVPTADAADGNSAPICDVVVYTAVVEPPSGAAAPQVWDEVFKTDAEEAISKGGAAGGVTSAGEAGAPRTAGEACESVDGVCHSGSGGAAGGSASGGEGSGKKLPPDVGGRYAYRPNWGEKEPHVHKRLFAMSLSRRVVAQVRTPAGLTAYSPAVTPCGKGVVFVAAQHEEVRRLGCSAYTTRPTSLFVASLPAIVTGEEVDVGGSNGRGEVGTEGKAGSEDSGDKGRKEAERAAKSWEDVAKLHGGVAELLAGGVAESSFGFSMPTFSPWAMGWGDGRGERATRTSPYKRTGGGDGDVCPLAFVIGARTLAHSTSAGLAVAAWPPTVVAFQGDAAGSDGADMSAMRMDQRASSGGAAEEAAGDPAAGACEETAGIVAAAKKPRSGLRLHATTVFGARQCVIADVPAGAPRDGGAGGAGAATAAAKGTSVGMHTVVVDGLAWVSQPVWFDAGSLLVETFARSVAVPLLLNAIPSLEALQISGATSSAGGDDVGSCCALRCVRGRDGSAGSAGTLPVKGRVIFPTTPSAAGVLPAEEGVGEVMLVGTQPPAVAVMVSSMGCLPKLYVTLDATAKPAKWGGFDLAPTDALRDRSTLAGGGGGEGWLGKKGGVYEPPASVAASSALALQAAVDGSLRSATFNVVPADGDVTVPAAMELLKAHSKAMGGEKKGEELPAQAGDVVVLRCEPKGNKARQPENAGDDARPADVAEAVPAGRPVVVWIHGGPHAQVVNRFMILPALLAAAGCTVIFANYVGSTGFGRAFTEALVGHCGRLDVAWMCRAMALLCTSNPPTLPVPLAKLLKPGTHPPMPSDGSDELSWGGAALRGTKFVAPVAVTGGSHGGFLSGHLAGVLGKSLSACVMINAVTYLPAMVASTDIPDWCVAEAGVVSARAWEPPFALVDAEAVSRLFSVSPYARIRTVKAPTLLLTGAGDLRVPKEQNKLWYNALKQLGVPVRMRWYEGQGHAIAGAAQSMDVAIEHAAFLLTKLLRR